MPALISLLTGPLFTTILGYVSQFVGPALAALAGWREAKQEDKIASLKSSVETIESVTIIQKAEAVAESSAPSTKDELVEKLLDKDSQI